MASAWPPWRYGDSGVASCLVSSPAARIDRRGTATLPLVVRKTAIDRDATSRRLVSPYWGRHLAWCTLPGNSVFLAPATKTNLYTKPQAENVQRWVKVVGKRRAEPSCIKFARETFGLAAGPGSPKRDGRATLIIGGPCQYKLLVRTDAGSTVRDPSPHHAHAAHGGGLQHAEWDGKGLKVDSRRDDADAGQGKISATAPTW